VGKSYYVLPNNTMYRRVKDTQVTEARHSDGFVSLRFSGNLAVMKTNPGYASRMAYDIDNANLEHVLGTVAGDDTIMIVFEEGVSKEVVRLELAQVIRM
jgi:transcriptional regulator of arginine metabolism